jgi:hypothetical protein
VCFNSCRRCSKEITKSEIYSGPRTERYKLMLLLQQHAKRTIMENHVTSTEHCIWLQNTLQRIQILHQLTCCFAPPSPPPPTNSYFFCPSSLLHSVSPTHPYTLNPTKSVQYKNLVCNKVVCPICFITPVSSLCFTLDFNRTQGIG